MGYYVLFYHYTSAKGLREIKSSGFIKNSSHDNNHAHFGEGTYGTSLPPSLGKQKVAQNNWRDYGKYYVQNGKVDWAIEVTIPHNKVRKISKRNRDILIHAGPIYLKDYPWRALKVPDTYDPSDDDDDDFGVSARYSLGRRSEAYTSAQYRGSDLRRAITKEAVSSASYSPRWSTDDYNYDDDGDYNYDYNSSWIRTESKPTKQNVSTSEGGWGCGSEGGWVVAATLISFGLYYFFYRR